MPERLVNDKLKEVPIEKNKGYRRYYAQAIYEHELRLRGSRRVLARIRAVSDGQAWASFLWRHNHKNEIPEIKIYSDRGDFDILMVEEPPLPVKAPF